jgi:hypothetical protein
MARRQAGRKWLNGRSVKVEQPVRPLLLQRVVFIVSGQTGRPDRLLKNPLNKKDCNKIRNQSYIWYETFRDSIKLKLICMKPGSIVAGRILAGLLVAGTLFTLIAWDQKQSPDQYQKQDFTDTTPKKKSDREKKIRDLDDVIEELDAVDMKIDMEKAQKEMEKAMKEWDGQKLKLEMEKAMKSVDFEKIQKEMKEVMAKLDIDMTKMQKEWQESMKEFDGEKMKLEMEKAMKEVDMGKIQKEIQEFMAKVDWEKMNKEMEEVKKVDWEKIEKEMAKVKEEMEKIGPQVEKEMQKAKVEIEKAKAEMKEYKSFVDGLEKDGLIKKSEGYSIKHKDGELIINGKKVSNETCLKYRSFLEKHPKFDIKKTDDDFDLDID